MNGNAEDSDGAGGSGSTRSSLAEIKIVVVGDGAVGKTCLCNVFVNRRFPKDYVPTCFENHAKEMVVDGQRVNMQLWDTAGQEDFDRIRVLSYENTHCFVVCFSVTDSVTLSNVRNLWLKELRQHAPEAQVLLAGTKADLRGKKPEEKREGERYEEVTKKKIRRTVKECGLAGYVETSAMRGGEDVDRVFVEAVRVAVRGGAASGASAASGSDDEDGVDGSEGGRRQPWLFSCFQ